MGDPTPPACGLPGFVDRGVGAVRDVSCLGELNRRSAAIQLQQQSRGALARRRPRRQRRAQAPARLAHRSAAPGVDAARGSGSARGRRAPRRLLAGAEEITPARSPRWKVPASLRPQAVNGPRHFPTRSVCSLGEMIGRNRQGADSTWSNLKARKT